MKNFILLYFIGANLAFSFSKKTDETPKPTTPSSSSSSSSASSVSSLPFGEARAKILSHVENSACYKYRWKNRGQIPLGFLQGMAVTFYKNKDQKPTDLGNTDKDALAYYGIRDISKASEYAFLVGLAMRESSGRHCVGRDTTANNGTHITTEAGPFQFSYNSRAADSRLTPLYYSYKGSSLWCELELYSRKVTCKPSDWVNHGSGEGVKFQETAKKCPAFSVEYAAILIRTLRKHFGPIIRKEVEYRPECLKMFQEISKF